MKSYAFFLTDEMLDIINASLVLGAVTLKDSEPDMADRVRRLREGLLVQRASAVDANELSNTLDLVVKRLRA
jgi:hypothetical protein